MSLNQHLNHSSLNFSRKDDPNLLLSSENKKSPICFEIAGFTSTNQFLLLSGSIFLFYCIFGYYLELTFRNPGVRDFGLYLTLIQFVLYTIFSYLELKQERGMIGRKVPFSTYAQIAFYTVASLGLSNASLGYLNYPTQVIFKCCKLIPVLIGGILIQGKRFTFIDCSAAVLMSVGLIFFTLADNRLSPIYHSKGYTMISCALIADAVIGNVQEKAMKAHSASTTEVIFYSYSIGAMYLLTFTMVTGEFGEAFIFCLYDPIKTYGYAMIFSIAGYLGLDVVLFFVKQFGALIAVTVTTCRKGLTIVLSFIFFAKPFTIQVPRIIYSHATLQRDFMLVKVQLRSQTALFMYVWSGLIVVLGIYLNVYSKRRSEINNLFFGTVNSGLANFRKRTYIASNLVSRVLPSRKTSILPQKKPTLVDV